MDNARRRQFGRRAMQHGTPDWAQNDRCTNAIDTIANILHAVAMLDEVDGVLDAALMYYQAERLED